LFARLGGAEGRLALTETGFPSATTVAGRAGAATAIPESQFAREKALLHAVAEDPHAGRDALFAQLGGLDELLDLSMAALRGGRA
jgi:hypothetical protein